MRFNGLGVGVHKRLKYIITVELVNAPRQSFVAFLQPLADFSIGFVRQPQSQKVIHHALAPQRVEFGAGATPLFRFWFKHIGLRAAEIKTFLQQFQRQRDALIDAHPIHAEHVKSDGEIALAQIIRQSPRSGVETVDVVDLKKRSPGIKCFQIFFKHLRSKDFIKIDFPIVIPLQHLVNDDGRFCLTGSGEQLR